MTTPSQIASVEQIERELARRPVGATLRREPPASPVVAEEEDAAATDWAAAIPRAGRYYCAMDCGGEVERPGVCAACGALRDAEDARAEFAAALDSVPEKFRWTLPRAPEINERVRPIVGTMAIMQPADAVDQAVRHIITGRIHTFTIYSPEPDTGKTSLACAIFHAIVYAGIDSWLAYRRTHGADRLARLHPEPRIIGLARGARFVAARDILPGRDRGPDAPAPAYATARNATLTVLDELGQEVETRDGAHLNAASSARGQASTEVIAHRWDLGRPTIITTPFHEDEIARMYSGSIQKRTAKGREARVIKLGGLHGTS